MYYASNVLAAAPIAIQDYPSLTTDAGDSNDYLSLDLELESCAGISGIRLIESRQPRVQVAQAKPSIGH